MKIALAALLLLASAAAVGMGIISAPASAQPMRKVPVVVMRALPGNAASQLAMAQKAPAPAPIGEKAAPSPAPAPAPAKEDDDLAALKPKAAEPKPAPAPVAEKPAPAPVAEKPAPKPAPVAEKPAPAAEKPEPKAEPAPAPVAAKPAPAPKPANANEGIVPATGGAAPVGQFNLRASDTADVYVDGKKVGGSPILGLKVKPGKHKVRFDCYDASGEARAGPTQTHDVAADGEKDVEYECPE